MPPRLLGPHVGEGNTITWLTPPWIMRELGKFDLDPCCPGTMPWRTADRMIHEPEDGLSVKWEGRVWLNPPYGKCIDRWLSRLAAHGRGVSLVFARTDTQWAQDAFFKATSVLFIKRRLTFCDNEGVPAPNSAGCGSMLLAYGQEDSLALNNSSIEGKFLML